MNSQLREDQKILIKKIAEEENIGEYEVEVNSGSVKGDGYMGEISMVNLIGDHKKLNLILKTADTNEEIRKQTVTRRAFLREIYIYNKIFPQFEIFQIDHGLRNGFKAFAKLYGSCDEDCKEFLILENLKEAGYKLWNRKVPVDSEHVALVFSEYGKFHAVSLAMRDREPEKFRELTKDLRNIYENTYTKEEGADLVKGTLDKGFKAVKGDDGATLAFQRFSDGIGYFLNETMYLPEDSIVIIHGDSWCNNMMFKYEDRKNPQKPTRVCLLDWQLSNRGSPVLDLAYFFFVCSSKDIIYDYKSYLKIYHETVTGILNELSCDPEKVFPYALLEDHWKKYAKHGLYMALVMITLMLSEVDEVPIFKEVVKNEGNIFNSLNYDGVHVNEYNKRILDIVNFMAEHELI